MDGKSEIDDSSHVKVSMFDDRICPVFTTNLLLMIEGAQIISK